MTLNPYFWDGIVQWLSSFLQIIPKWGNCRLDQNPWQGAFELSSRVVMGGVGIVPKSRGRDVGRGCQQTYQVLLTKLGSLRYTSWASLSQLKPLYPLKPSFKLFPGSFALSTHTHITGFICFERFKVSLGLSH